MVRFDPFPSLPNKKTHVFPHMSLFVFSYPADDGQPVRSGFWGDDYVEIFAFSPLFGRKTTPFGEVLKGRGIFVCEANFRVTHSTRYRSPPGNRLTGWPRLWFGSLTTVLGEMKSIVVLL